MGGRGRALSLSLAYSAAARDDAALGNDLGRTALPGSGRLRARSLRGSRSRARPAKPTYRELGCGRASSRRPCHARMRRRGGQRRVDGAALRAAAAGRCRGLPSAVRWQSTSLHRFQLHQAGSSSLITVHCLYCICRRVLLLEHAACLLSRWLSQLQLSYGVFVVLTLSPTPHPPTEPTNNFGGGERLRYQYQELPISWVTSDLCDFNGPVLSWPLPLCPRAVSPEPHLPSVLR